MLETLVENIAFVGVSLLIFAAILLCAKLLEKHCGGKRKVSQARYAAFIALFSAMAGVLMLFDFPVFFAPGFYKLDLSEIPVLLCSFYLGPTAGVGAELLKVVLKVLLKGTTTAFVGDFASFFVGCFLILPASAIYCAGRTKKRALLGLGAGALCMSVVGSLFNAFYLIPRFSQLYGIPLEAIIAMGTKINPSITGLWSLVAFAVLPFNLLKGIADSAVTMLVYKPMSRFISKKSEK